MNTRSCFFIGHREADEKLLPVLKAEVQRHIEELGVTEFIVGHYGGFDHLAVQAVCAAKKEHPDICLSVLLPYHPAERPVKTSKGWMVPTIHLEWSECLGVLPSSGPIGTWWTMWIF